MYIRTEEYIEGLRLHPRLFTEEGFIPSVSLVWDHDSIIHKFWKITVPLCRYGTTFERGAVSPFDLADTFWRFPDRCKASLSRWVFRKCDLRALTYRPCCFSCASCSFGRSVCSLSTSRDLFWWMLALWKDVCSLVSASCGYVKHLVNRHLPKCITFQAYHLTVAPSLPLKIGADA